MNDIDEQTMAESGNIDPESAIEPSTTANSKKIIMSCRQLADKHVTALFSKTFNKLDDDLFNLSGKTEDDEERTAYFEGLREIRIEKEVIEKEFHAQYTKNFSNGLKIEKKGKSQSTNETESADGLSLVDDAQLEESLAIDNLIGKLQEHFNAELYCLNERLNHLFPDADIGDSKNPMGPAAICNAFRDATNKLNVNIRVKLIMYKLFDHFNMNCSEEFYQEINNLLIQAGVLPTLQPKAKQSSSSSPRPRDSSSDQTDADESSRHGHTGLQSETGQAASPSQSMVQPQMFQALHQLLGGRLPQAGGESSTQGETDGDAPVSVDIPQIPVTPRLLEALTSIQLDNTQSDIESVESIKDLKEKLSSQISEDGEQRPINQLDDETIDVIGMIFEYILDDKSLPDAMKALISRMQIPILKVAMIDRGFFSKKSHPARQLLNELSRAGQGINSEDELASDRLYEKMDYVVQRILSEFEGDLTIFEQLLDEFREFVNEDEQEFNLAQQKFNKDAREAELIQKHKRTIAEEIAAMLVDRDVPDDLRSFLMDPWRDVLTVVTDHEGEDGQARKRYTRIVEDLVWSVEPIATKEDRKRLVALLPVILETLDEGLKMIDYSNEQIDDVIKMLEKYHLANIKHKLHGTDESEIAHDQAGPVDSSVSENTSAIGMDSDSNDDLPDLDMDIMQDIGIPETRNHGAFEKMMEEMGFSPEIDDGPRIDDEFTEQVRALELGTWVELTEDDGKKIRAKLAWKGDEYSSFSFVNRRCKVVAERPLYVLADEFRQGISTVIEDVALFDNALDGIFSNIIGQES